MNKLERLTDRIFENIKHIDAEGNEYWLARELQKILEYNDWRNFNKVIEKAIMSAKISCHNKNYWGVEVTSPIISGKGKINKSNLWFQASRINRRYGKGIRR